ncbi:ArsR/SmtB family transcription factor [Kitasatospora sp. NPDC051853]|uniref:ArsR/SmtB family transcription factor n=1 Tax=Kitasatospora sp. NPDC051853 TaxID=3364058 RepID=UPI00379BFC90
MVEQLTEREVTDVATLKALADPVRIAIMNALYRREPQELTVKEIAAALDEPPTKLYRHIKQLEQVGLIMVAGTRLVSGITESRYRLGQKTLHISNSVFASDSEERPQALNAMLAALDQARDEYRRLFLAGRLGLPSTDPARAASPSLFSNGGLRLSPARALELRDRLAAVIDEALADGNSTDPDAVEVSLMLLYYAVKPLPPAED